MLTSKEIKEWNMDKDQLDFYSELDKENIDLGVDWGLASNAIMVRAFHHYFGAAMDKGFKATEDLILREALVKEEANELSLAFSNILFDPDSLEYQKNLIKELTDVLYVVYGTFATLGVNADEVFEAVHRSNMSKLVDGQAIKNEHGKVMKGPNYRPPDLSSFVDTKGN